MARCIFDAKRISRRLDVMAIGDGTTFLPREIGPKEILRSRVFTNCFLPGRTYYWPLSRAFRCGNIARWKRIGVRFGLHVLRPRPTLLPPSGIALSAKSASSHPSQGLRSPPPAARRERESEKASGEACSSTEASSRYLDTTLRFVRKLYSVILEQNPRRSSEKSRPGLPAE